MLDYRHEKSLQGLNLDTEAQESKLPPEQKPKSAPAWQGLTQPWDNLKFRTKLAMLLMISAAVPVIAVTQGLVTLNKSHQLAQLKESLQKDGKAFTQDYVLWPQVESEAQAENISKLIQATKIDLSNPSEVSNRRSFLQDFLTIHNGSQMLKVEQLLKIFKFWQIILQVSLFYQPTIQH
jgi:hypothetical protein